MCICVRDTVLRGGVAGAAGTVAQAALNWLWLLLGWTGDTLTHSLARTIFVLPPAQEVLGGQLAVALFAQLLIGGVYGIVLALILLASGHDFALVKGWVAGALIGIFHLAIVPFMARIPVPQPLTLVVLHLLDHMVWGVVTSAIIAALFHRVRRVA